MVYQYWRRQKDGLMFSWDSELDPKAELLTCLNMGAGLEVLCVWKPQGYVKVFDIKEPNLIDEFPSFNG